MDNFVIIYKILKVLEAAMDYAGHIKTAYRTQGNVIFFHVVFFHAQMKGGEHTDTIRPGSHQGY